MLIRALPKRDFHFRHYDADRPQREVLAVCFLHALFVSVVFYCALLRTVEGPRSKGLLLHTFSSLKETVS